MVTSIFRSTVSFPFQMGLTKYFLSFFLSRCISTDDRSYLSASGGNCLYSATRLQTGHTPITIQQPQTSQLALTTPPICLSNPDQWVIIATCTLNTILLPHMCKIECYYLSKIEFGFRALYIDLYLQCSFTYFKAFSLFFIFFLNYLLCYFEN